MLDTTGCYLGHLAAGQARVLRARRPIADVLADPATAPALAATLRLVEEVRAYADGLGLEVGGQYTSYVDWPGDRIVTTVVAAKPGTVEARGFWFPIVGRVPYKGYFDRERAAAEAERLRAQGLDVCEVAVPAYSTLGWMDDPVTAPMLRRGEGRLIETVLHELVHATVYVAGEADFNEGVASFVGEEASLRFYEARELDVERRRQEVADARLLDAALLDLRDAVAALYAETEAGPQRDARRDALEAAARERLAALPLATRDPAEIAERARLNDACLALRSTYAADVEAYRDVLVELEGDLGRFVARLRGVADAEDPRTAFFSARLADR